MEKEETNLLQNGGSKSYEDLFFNAIKLGNIKLIHYICSKTSN
jgi:hypothetical protein